MATVRMSRAVIEKIQENASKAFLKSDPFKTFPNDLGDRIYNRYYEPVLSTLEKAHAHEYVNLAEPSSLNSIDIDLSDKSMNDFINPTKTDTFGERAYRNTYYNSISVPLSSPRKFFDEGRAPSHVELPKGSDHYNEICDILNYNEDVYIRAKDNHSKITTVIEACVTVNQFIKAWPAGASHVPEEALQKANQRSVQKQAAEQRRALVEDMETDLNTSILTSSLLD